MLDFNKRYKPGCLVLEDGQVIEVFGCGAQGIRIAELCFNTATTGYQEIMTDPSYYQQIVIFTFPHIGIVGTNRVDMENGEDIYLSGVILRNPPDMSDNFRAQESLDEWLKERGIIGLWGIDTRSLTKKLRDQGFINAAICHLDAEEMTALDTAKLAKEAKDFKALQCDLASQISTSKSYQWAPLSNEDYYKTPYTPNPQVFNKKVAVIDFGLKISILSCLHSFGAQVIVLPATTTLQEIQQLDVQGIVLSNGPGDPAYITKPLPLITQLLDTDIPILGICLGFQLLAIALGCVSEKMKFGHHGANHPVVHAESKQVFITSQNHGFSVNLGSLSEQIIPTHFSLFDNSLAGFRLRHKNVFAVQYHPEASPGPHDSLPIFQQFLDSISLQ